MAKEEISPEEKLLNIIEEEDKKTLKKSGQAGIENPGGAGKPAINIKNLKAWIHKIHSAKKWPFFTEKYPLAEINMKVVNKILLVFFIGLAAFLILDFAGSRADFKKIYAGTSALPAAPLKKRRIIPLDPLPDYLNLCRKRDIFSPLTEKSKKEKTPFLSELIKDLSLVGIYWGKYPEAMIEHTKEKKTYFLKPGQAIKGIKVKAIFKDRVILEYNSEEMELI